MLGLPKEGVACGWAGDAGPVPAGAGQPGYGAPVIGAAQKQVIGDGDAAEEDHVINAYEREDPPAFLLRVEDADRVALEMQAGSGGLYVERVEQFSHAIFPKVGG